MPTIRTIALLALALSHPAAAADGDAVAAAGAFRHPGAEATLQDGARPLRARGPGARFASVEAAAVDALIYAHLQALASHDTDRIRGGTIFAIDHGYSYGSIQVAHPRTPQRIFYRLGRRDVARFHAYPVLRDIHVNRRNERLSLRDRRSVSVADPLHRPLYVLHPSLAIRVYRGEASEPVEVTDLRRPQRAARLAGN
jgi:hypothetical protein